MVTILFNSLYTQLPNVLLRFPSHRPIRSPNHLVIIISLSGRFYCSVVIGANTSVLVIAQREAPAAIAQYCWFTLVSGIRPFLCPVLMICCGLMLYDTSNLLELNAVHEYITETLSGFTSEWMTAGTNSERTCCNWANVNINVKLREYIIICNYPRWPHVAAIIPTWPCIHLLLLVVHFPQLFF